MRAAPGGIWENSELPLMVLQLFGLNKNSRIIKVKRREGKTMDDLL